MRPLYISSKTIHESPNFMRTFWYFKINVVGLIFPIPLKALVESQPVKACNSRREVHNGGVKFEPSLVISINFRFDSKP